jgi:hypothetical protein
MSTDTLVDLNINFVLKEFPTFCLFVLFVMFVFFVVLTYFILFYKQIHQFRRDRLVFFVMFSLLRVAAIVFFNWRGGVAEGYNCRHGEGRLPL